MQKIKSKLKLPTGDELEELQNFMGEYCLSMYAPYIQPNSAENPNSVEIRNLIKQAHKLLIEDGLKEREADEIIQPAKDFLNTYEQTFSRGEGIAIFSHPKLFKAFKIPYAIFPESVSTGEKFNLDPLIESMDGNTQYYLLTLGHKNVRLFEGDRYSIKEIHIKNFPSDMKSALHIDEYPKSRETHNIKPASFGKGSQAFHGQYNVAETDKKMLKDYFRLLDHFLHSFLSKSNKALLLAGVKYEVAMYQKINTYPGLLKEAIYGNQDDSSFDNLKEKATEIIKRTFYKQ